ncbi:dTDP-4-dehydrorhamnose 3,5-epimerase [Vibrio fluvialis]|uniref:dTDP-4-dehydrorhamnose 3,5-epimerase n=1 Tax=Vibrio fluvialis TaxID=676 RepID=UPI00117D623D|nr:dTDP-4-dehydrorhamnose 3,5-epimerase [Vibrio fluvialis]EKO3435212.1 dTDP-4-dehydrorhamnose 3,5-epimerase [Vibrio fluvialis]MBY7800085.1 dTDP-4-dehydrorhamnose 3,5-epimerase [Vibrio fluvialis]MBY8091475.1 dTDP-4-dehydrorhamnose 3,5-epimerase [Vibrio fluvialis]MBY8100547.1 dTDP-4-dehydrorhamnose 3,5-epimerase [Vibrio fluvialis]MBY8215413.1 dTDP-4-dehydrorhamnose 3,5-epimerase [Vibrio fluvialis]
MKIIETKLKDVYLIEPKVFEDKRGFFMESFNSAIFNKAVGRDVIFVQDNHSKSSRGVLRGLHYQTQNAQGKLVRVTKGKVLDVAVDLRVNSPTFKQWASFELSESNKRQLWIPEGFAHGFVCLSDEVEFLYKTTDYYSPQFEASIVWNDPELSIDWILSESELIISEKDKNGMLLKDAKLFS